MLKKTTLTLFALMAVTAASDAQLLTAFDVSGSGATATATPSPVVGGGVTATGLTRNTVNYSAANNSFSSNNWNTTATLNTAANYIEFDVTAGTGAVTLSTLQFAINGSNTAPNTGTWGYSLDGGTTFTLGTTTDGGTFTNLNPQPTSQRLWDFADFSLAAGATVDFRFFEYGTTSINGGTSSATGTTRIANITGNGNPQYDLLLSGPTAFVQPVNVPEPTSLAFIGAVAGLLGLAIYRRNRTA